jgi:NCS1 family nucleobase:cation symporter-1
MSESVEPRASGTENVHPAPSPAELRALDPEGRLHNADLAPSSPEQRRWSTYSLFAFWSNTCHNLGSYTFAAGLFALGLNAWEVALAILLGTAVVFGGCLLSGVMGYRTGVPFPVVSRISWGVFGANVPAMIRALAAILWYGVQTYLATEAINAILERFVPSTATLANHELLGLDGRSWLSFLILWSVQLLILSRGMEIVRHAQGLSGAVVWLLMIIAAIYLVIKSGGRFSLTSGGSHLDGGQQIYHIFATMGLLMGILGTLMLNYADFTRFAPSERSLRRGSLLGVPLNWVLFSVTSVIVSSASYAVYGKAILNPADLFEHLNNGLLLVVGALLLILATVGVNIIANFVSPAFDLANVYPKRISFRLGGLIAAVVALASLPWKLYSTPVVINDFLGGLGALVGPLFGIMIVDYFIIKRSRVSVIDMYDPSGSSQYHYRRGVNLRAVGAFVPAATLAVVVALVPILNKIAPFAWYIGTAAAAGLYWVIASTAPETDREPARTATDGLTLGLEAGDGA